MATKLANLRCFVAILHLSQYARFCRLWAILKQGLQAPRGILQPRGRVSWFFSFISSIFYLLSSLPDMALWESKYDGMGWSYALQYPFVRNSIPSEPVDYRRVSTFAQILSWKILLSCKDVSPVTRPPEPGTAMNNCFRRISFFRIICVFLGSVIAPEM